MSKPTPEEIEIARKVCRHYAQVGRKIVGSIDQERPDEWLRSLDVCEQLFSSNPERVFSDYALEYDALR